MNKTALALTLGALLTATAVQADTLGGIYVGAQYWDLASDGTINDDNASADFDLGDDAKGSVWIAIEHPIPLLPNFKARYNQLDGEGVATLNGEIVIDDKTFADDTEMALDAKLDHVDAVLYYELLDNDLVSLDLGLNIKVGDFELTGVGEDPSGAAISASGSYSGPIPLLYAAGEIGLPLTGLGLFGEVSGLAYSGNQFYDAQAGLGYNVLDNPAIVLTAQLGYRIFKLKAEDLDDINADIQFDGAFAGLVAHF